MGEKQNGLPINSINDAKDVVDVPKDDMKLVQQNLEKVEVRNDAKTKLLSTKINVVKNIKEKSNRLKKLEELNLELNETEVGLENAINDSKKAESLFFVGNYKKENKESILTSLKSLPLTFMLDSDKSLMIKFVSTDLNNDGRTGSIRSNYEKRFKDYQEKFKKSLDDIALYRKELNDLTKDNLKAKTVETKVDAKDNNKIEKSESGFKVIDKVPVFADTYALNASQEMRHVFETKGNTMQTSDQILVKTLINELNKNGYKIGLDGVEDLKDSLIVKMIGAYQEIKGLKVDGKFGPQTFAKLKSDLPAGVELAKRGSDKSSNDKKLGSVLKRRSYYNAIPARLRKSSEKSKSSAESLSKYVTLNKEFKAYKSLLVQVKNKVADKIRHEGQTDELLKLYTNLNLSIDTLRPIQGIEKSDVKLYDSIDSYLISKRVLKASELISVAGDVGVKPAEILMKNLNNSINKAAELVRKSVQSGKLDASKVKLPNYELMKRFNIVSSPKLNLDFRRCAELVAACSTSLTASNVKALDSFMDNTDLNFLTAFSLANPEFGSSLKSIFTNDSVKQFISKGNLGKVNSLNDAISRVGLAVESGADKVKELENLFSRIQELKEDFEREEAEGLVNDLVLNKDDVLSLMKNGPSKYYFILKDFSEKLFRNGLDSTRYNLDFVLREYEASVKTTEKPNMSTSNNTTTEEPNMSIFNNTTTEEPNMSISNNTTTEEPLSSYQVVDAVEAEGEDQ